MKFYVVIPARYNSSRLEGKVLYKLGKKTVLQHVYQRAIESTATEVVIATDDVRIYDEAKSFGAEVVMTAVSHPNGSSRIAEACQLKQWALDSIVVNLQADEPFMPEENIQQVAKVLSSSDSDCSTLKRPINNREDLLNPNVVKVACNYMNEALYFSRSCIPYTDQLAQHEIMNIFYRHIGLYAYRINFLNDYLSMKESPLENIERLEQLRILWHGHKIAVPTASKDSPLEINTKQDYLNAKEYYSSCAFE